MGKSQAGPRSDARPRVLGPSASGDDRETDLARRTLAVTAREEAMAACMRTAREILAAADRRDGLADARDDAAERRDRERDLAGFLDPDGPYGADLPERREAALDREQAREDRAAARRDRLALTRAWTDLDLAP